MSEVINKSKLAKETTGVLASLTTGQKNEALLVMADALRREAPAIITANAEDLERGRLNGTPESMLG